MEKFEVDTARGVPAYRQLADRLHAEIRSGVLPYGTQLPTVRDMAKKTELSPGTVQKTYDRLQELGDIEMTRRRGTFVVFRREDGTDSRKLRAMAAIDRMLTTLGGLHLTPAEIGIFVNLRMREWGLRQTNIRLGAVTAVPECKTQLREAFSDFANVTVSVWDLEQVLRYPFPLNEETDLIVVPFENAAALSEALPDTDKLVRMAVSPDKESLIALALAEKRVVAVSETGTLKSFIAPYLRGDAGETVATVSFADLRALPRSVTVVIVDGSEAECSVAELNALADIENDGRLIRLRVGPDEGSLLMVEERLKALKSQRQTMPTAVEYGNA